MFDRDALQKLEQRKTAWEQGPVAKAMERFGERSEEFRTTSELPVERLYTPLEVAETEYERDLGLPGEYPYTRGIQPTMYRGRLWTMRQYAGFGTAEESNRRYKYLLEQGQTGLSVAFDLPTQIGYDSDHSLSRGEVGKVGVAIDSLADMELLFDGIPLDQVSTSMTINAPAAILLAMYAALAQKQGVPLDKLRGTIQNDILKEYVARGTYIFPPQPSMRLVSDTFAFCAEHMSNWNTISISGYHMREAGCNAVQEVAFTLANAVAYVKAALDAGLDVDTFAPRLSFFFDAHNDLLEEVSKFRAARKLWAQIMKERFGAQDPRSMMLRFHTQTAGSALTAQQPDNNVVRVTLQALAAVLGGTQSLHTNSREEALALPTEDSVRIALRTQQILAHESGVVNTVDPLAGSYYVESLTREIEQRVLEYIDKIEELGGSARAIEQGYIQREIQESAYTHQREIENEERVVVGVNKYRISEEPPTNLLRVDPVVERQEREKLEQLRAQRNQAHVDEALEGVRVAAGGQENLFPRILKAVTVYATLGEICDVLRDEFGTHQASVVF